MKNIQSKADSLDLLIFCIGFFAIFLFSGGCLRNSPKGDREIDGRVIAYGKPAVGYTIRFKLQGRTKFEAITDSTGGYIFRFPREIYHFDGWSFEPDKREENEKLGKGLSDSEITIYDNISENIPFDEKGFYLDLRNNSQITIPPFFISRCVSLYGPDDGSVINDTEKGVFSWAMTLGASRYKFLIGKVVKQYQAAEKAVIFKGVDKYNTHIWAPIDTFFLVKDTSIDVAFVLKHISKPQEPSPRYYWAVMACDSAGYQITGSVHNKYFYPVFSSKKK